MNQDHILLSYKEDPFIGLFGQNMKIPALIIPKIDLSTGSQDYKQNVLVSIEADVRTYNVAGNDEDFSDM
jgi:hypothetical protein